MKIALAGGGTAGHVFPAIALADRLRDDQGADVSFVGSADGQEASLVPAAGYAFHPIRVEKMARELTWGSMRAPFVTLRSIGACRPIVRGCDAIVGLGGYASAPVVLAARRERVPVLLVEQNAIPGLANRLLARFAEAIALAFADARSRLPPRIRIEVTGNPVRASIRAVPAGREALAKEAMVDLGLEPDRRTIVVFGGSQGALHLDRTVAAMLPLLRDRSDLQLLVAAGSSHVDVVASVVDPDAALVVRVHGFLERMDLACAVADLAVARAGSGHIAELAVCAVPSILIPYPHATGNHQEANARELERAGAAEVILEADLSADLLARRITELGADGARLAAMGDAAERWAKPDADRRLAELVTEVAG